MLSGAKKLLPYAKVNGGKTSCYAADSKGLTPYDASDIDYSHILDASTHCPIQSQDAQGQREVVSQEKG